MKLEDVATWVGILLGMITVALVGITLTAAASGVSGWTVAGALAAAVSTAAITIVGFWIAYGSNTRHHA
jgi:hypothetical protein